jgi:D-serine deaminase-like pyridoxal phosphate-dependent protein
MRAILIAILFIASAPLFAASAPPDYFSALNAELKAHDVSRPIAVIDLDRLDANIDALKSHVQPPLMFRVVEKSLPSVELLRYILARTGSKRGMAFHYPFLKTLLTELGDDVEFLFGKTIPVGGAREIFAELSPEQKKQAVRRVQWLADTKKTLQELLDFFREQDLPFLANVEIDVGMHRGGARNLQELEEILALIQANPSRVTFTGLMGYDGHVPHLPVPELGGLKLKAMARAVVTIEKRYRRFHDLVRDKFPELYKTARTFNGAGSGTYQLYHPGSIVSDISAGSALLKPKDYDMVTLKDHSPAVYIATPVLKRIHPAKIPILGGLPFGKKTVQYVVYGGGWQEEPEYPALKNNFFLKGTPNSNQVPNQMVLFGKLGPEFGPGDYAFFRPGQSDAIFRFERILAVRAGKIADTWHAFPIKY